MPYRAPYKQKRIVIVGGGFAGLRLVKILSRSGYEVILIDRNNYHIFQPLLYQAATSALEPGDIAFPFRKLLRGKKNVHFRLATVMHIDPGNKTVETDRGSISYDQLVLASGSAANFFGMEHVEAGALAMKTLDDAVMIRNTVISNLERSMTETDPSVVAALRTIVVVGGGPTGTELAGALAEMKKFILARDFPEMNVDSVRIILVEGSAKLIGTMSDRTSQGTYDYLSRIGVEIMLNAQVVDYSGANVMLKGGGKIAARTLVWTSGVAVRLPTGLDGATVGKSGRILTDEDFRVVSYPDIFAVGDAGMQQSEKYPNGAPQLGREAIMQADHVGRLLSDLAAGRRTIPYRRRDYPVLATVGRNHAFMEYGRFFLKGFPAFIAWGGIHLYLLLGVRNKIAVLLEWIWNYITHDMPSRLILGQIHRSPEEERK